MIAAKVEYAGGKVSIWPAPELGPGGRRLGIYHGTGDSWSVYLTVPRGPGLVARFREALTQLHPVTPESAYSPTGRAFWGAPVVIRRPRVVVIRQDGGLDV